jgi:uncharacterized membrane protein YbaN (DUF454 family)
MSFDTLYREPTRNIVDAFAFDAPAQALASHAPLAAASPSLCREPQRQAAPGSDAAGPWIGCSESLGVIEIHDPRLLRPGYEAFCRALVSAAVNRFEARVAEVRMESSTCRLEFGPGRFDRAEMAGRVAAAVRAATLVLRDGAASRDQAGAGAGAVILATHVSDGPSSPPSPRGAALHDRAAAKRPAAAPTGSWRLVDLAKAGGSLALAVGGIILPGIPSLPFLILTGRYASRVSSTIKRLLKSRPWCAAMFAEVDPSSGRAKKGRPSWKTIGLAILGAAGFLVLRPPLPVAIGVELALMAFLGWRELSRPVCAGLVPLAA